jgi:hypothetical protein
MFKGDEGWFIEAFAVRPKQLRATAPTDDSSLGEFLPTEAMDRFRNKAWVNPTPAASRPAPRISSHGEAQDGSWRIFEARPSGGIESLRTIA